MEEKTIHPIIVDRPALLVIDIQKGSFMPDRELGIQHMVGHDERMANASHLIETARQCGVPLIFIQEVHRRDMVDFGRELDGQEAVHCLEGEESTEIADQLGMLSAYYLIRKRRYSAFSVQTSKSYSKD